jgi:hypothetical protein
VVSSPSHGCGLPPAAPPLQDEDDEVLRGGIEALRGHVLAFPKEAARGAMDRNMDDVDNLVVRIVTTL